MGRSSATGVLADVHDYGNHTDRELLHWIHEGQGDAEPSFRVLYERYGRRLLLYCTKVLGSQTAARDIVQDTFLTFLTKVRGGERIDSVPAYLLTIARNRCLNTRRDARLVYMEPEHLPDITVDDTNDRDEVRRHLAKAMEGLPERYREALMMQVYGGLSYAEICEATGETLPVVRHRISRAKQKLRSVLLPLFAT